MKKKHRDIVIDGITFAWSVGHPNCDGDGNNKLTIWKDKKIIYNSVVWNYIDVTPRFIRLFIKLYLIKK